MIVIYRSFIELFFLIWLISFDGKELELWMFYEDLCNIDILLLNILMFLK